MHWSSTPLRRTAWRLFSSEAQALQRPADRVIDLTLQQRQRDGNHQLRKASYSRIARLRFCVWSM